MITCSPDIVVIVRYPGYTRRAVIRQNRNKPSTRKRTKSGRLYAEQWRVVKWIGAEVVAEQGGRA